MKHRILLYYPEYNYSLIPKYNSNIKKILNIYKCLNTSFTLATLLYGRKLKAKEKIFKIRLHRKKFSKTAISKYNY